MNKREFQDFHSGLTASISDKYEENKAKGMLISISREHGFGVGAFGMDEDEYARAISALNSELNPGEQFNMPNLKVRNIHIKATDIALGVIFGSVISLFIWQLFVTMSNNA